MHIASRCTKSLPWTTRGVPVNDSNFRITRGTSIKSSSGLFSGISGRLLRPSLGLRKRQEESEAKEGGGVQLRSFFISERIGLQWGAGAKIGVSRLKRESEGGVKTMRRHRSYCTAKDGL